MLPLHLPIKPSPWHGRVVAVGVLITCLCVVSVSPPWWQWALFLLFSTISVYGWLKRYVWLIHPHSIVHIKATVSGWYMGLADGSERQVRLVHGCRFLPHLMVLRMRCEANQLWWCLLLDDSAPHDVLRRLRVIGRWRPHGEAMPLDDSVV